MDTLGHTEDGTLGLYECHNSGGNQVSLVLIAQETSYFPLCQYLMN